MPSIEWNKKAWTKNFEKFDGSPSKPYYGDGWGRPEDNTIRFFLKKLIHWKQIPGNLSKVVKRYIKPYLGADKTALEIGPGGGRWTQYLLGAKDVVVVDLNSIFFPYLKERFSGDLSKIRFYNTSGYELNGIESGSIDFVFTFGTFVHIEPEGIHAYLAEINRVLKPKGTAVMQYADKTKKRARELNGFTNMNPTKMESFITEYQFELVEHNIRLLNHSNIAVVRKN